MSHELPRYGILPPLLPNDLLGKSRAREQLGRHSCLNSKEFSILAKPSRVRAFENIGYRAFFCLYNTGGSFYRSIRRGPPLDLALKQAFQYVARNFNPAAACLR